MDIYGTFMHFQLNGKPDTGRKSRAILSGTGGLNG